MTIFSRKKDRLLGIPSLLALGGLEAERVGRMPEEVKSAAILCLTRPKNLIIALPFFTALKRKYPECRITVFTSEDNMRLAPLIDEADTFVRINPASLGESSEIIRASDTFDLWADLGTWSRFEAILSIKAPARYKVGFKTVGEMRHFAYDRVADYNKRADYSDNISKLAALIGLKIDYSALRPQKAEEDPKSIIFNMFPDSEEEKVRCWSGENWKKLTESMFKKGYKISVIGEKKHVLEADKFVESLSSGMDVDYLVGRLDMPALKNLILKTSAIVSVDAYPLYLARYLGTSCLGLFGPTYPRGVYFGGSAGITANVNCIGCQNFYGDEKCLVGKPICMDSIRPEEAEEFLLKNAGES